MLFKIDNDLHDIAARLREIDATYRLYRNGRLGRFEIHNSTQPSARSFCFAVPFDELDARTLDYARRTRKENFDLLESEINENNEVVEQSAIRSFRESESKLADMLEYAIRADRTVDFGKSKLWF